MAIARISKYLFDQFPGLHDMLLDYCEDMGLTMQHVTDDRFQNVYIEQKAVCFRVVGQDVPDDDEVDMAFTMQAFSMATGDDIELIIFHTLYHYK